MKQTSLPAVILAAGQGHRLLERSGGLPKPLVPVLGVPLLRAHACSSCRTAGITEGFVVVRLSPGDPDLPAVAGLGTPLRHGAACRSSNPLWEEGNGTSALALAPYLHLPFFLLMCDHVFEPEMLHHLRAAEDEADVSCSGPSLREEGGRGGRMPPGWLIATSRAIFRSAGRHQSPAQWASDHRHWQRRCVP